MQQERKELLTRLSRILRGNCYNGHIQNYARWGEGEGEGRWFTYPEKYIDEDGDRVGTPGDLHARNDRFLMDIHCAFGANMLFQYRALNEILDYLEKYHDLEISDHEVQLRLAREEEERQRQLHQEHIDELAQHLLEQPEDSAGAALVATAESTNMDRTYGFDEESQARSREEFASAVSRMLEVMSIDQPGICNEDLAEAADRAVALRRQEEMNRMMARYRSPEQTDEDE